MSVIIWKIETNMSLLSFKLNATYSIEGLQRKKSKLIYLLIKAHVKKILLDNIHFFLAYLLSKFKSTQLVELVQYFNIT